MRVLVTGSTGNVGRHVLRALSELQIDARAAVRPGSAASSDVRSVPLDFRDETTWDAALAGIDALFLLRPPAISDVGPTLNAFVDHAGSRLARVVFLSVAGAERNSIIPHAKVERHLKRGPIPFTFLRAGFFSDNLCGPYRQDIRDEDRIYVPAGHQAIAWVDARDLGEAAAQAFASPEAAGAAWTLTGGESRTFAEVAELLTRHLGRPIRYEPASVPGYLWHLLRRRGTPLAPALVYTVLHTAIRMGSQAEVDPTLARVLGRPPRTVEDTIRDNLDLWRR